MVKTKQNQGCNTSIASTSGYSRKFNYNTCIVTNHSDSDDDFSTTLPLGLQSPADVDEPSQRTSEKEDDESVTLDLEDYFVLMIGLAEKAEKLICRKENLDEEETRFVNEIKVVKNALRNIYNSSKEREIRDGNVNPSSSKNLNKKSMSTAKRVLQDTRQKENQVNGTAYEEGKVTNQKEIIKPVRSTNSETKSSGKKQTSERRKFYNRMVISPSNSDLPKRGEKRKLSSKDDSVKTAPKLKKQVDNIVASTPKLKSDVPKTAHRSNRQALLVDLYQLEQKARSLSVLNGEDFDLVFYNLKKEAGFNPTLPRKYRNLSPTSFSQIGTLSPNVTVIPDYLSVDQKAGPRGKTRLTPGTTRKSQQITKINKNNSSLLQNPGPSGKSRSKSLTPGARKSPRITKTNKINSGLLQHSAINNDSFKSNSMSSLGKRKLYSPGLWLEHFNSTCEPS